MHLQIITAIIYMLHLSELYIKKTVLLNMQLCFQISQINSIEVKSAAVSLVNINNLAINVWVVFMPSFFYILLIDFKHLELS